jgi:hypothetical protein
LCKNKECWNFCGNDTKHEYCSDYCKNRNTNVHRSRATTKNRENLINIRNKFERYINEGYSEDKLRELQENYNNKHLDKRIVILKQGFKKTRKEKNLF